MKQMRSLKRQGGWVQYAIAGAQIATSLAGGISGSRKAGNLADANIALIEMETKETLRRMENEQKVLEGEANVRASASGFTKKGSIEKYFTDLKTEYGNQVDWTKRVSAQRKKVARAGGSAAESQIKSTAIGGALQGAGNMANWYYS